MMVDCREVRAQERGAVQVVVQELLPRRRAHQVPEPPEWGTDYRKIHFLSEAEGRAKKVETRAFRGASAASDEKCETRAFRGASASERREMRVR